MTSAAANKRKQNKAKLILGASVSVSHEKASFYISRADLSLIC